MKIMQVMPEFGLAGAETMCENLTYELIKIGHDVIIVSLYDYHSAITERLETAGIRIHYLNKKNGLDLSMISRLVKVMREEKPDVIHTHRYVMQYAIPAAIISGVKRRVHTVHNVADKEVGSLAKILAKFFYKACSVTPVALSNEIQKTIENVYGLNIKRIPVILNGVDLSKCQMKESYEMHSPFVVLHVGRFTEQKNHIGLINAFAKFVTLCPESKLLLIGEGNKREEINLLVEEKNLKNKVTFLGTKDNVYQYYKECDVFVLPSNYEGIPMTLIEAMGSGTPIIANRVGGIPDMLTNGVDALIINNDVDELVEGLIKLHDERETREKLGRNAIINAEVFSSKTMAASYYEIYARAR